MTDRQKESSDDKQSWVKMRLNLEFLLNLHKQRESWKKTQIQFIISFIFSASQMLILNPSRYKREGTDNNSLFYALCPILIKVYHKTEHCVRKRTL